MSDQSNSMDDPPGRMVSFDHDSTERDNEDVQVVSSDSGTVSTPSSSDPSTPLTGITSLQKEAERHISESLGLSQSQLGEVTGSVVNSLTNSFDRFVQTADTLQQAAQGVVRLGSFLSDPTRQYPSQLEIGAQDTVVLIPVRWFDIESLLADWEACSDTSFSYVWHGAGADGFSWVTLSHQLFSIGPDPNSKEVTLSCDTLFLKDGPGSPRTVGLIGQGSDQQRSHLFPFRDAVEEHLWSVYDRAFPSYRDQLLQRLFQIGI